ncbi:MAG: radical SAM protein [Candidatus Omnitrophota bacterium]
MINLLRKNLSPKVKERIIHFLPFRLMYRRALSGHEARFSCELTTKCNVRCNICTRSHLIKEGMLSVGDMPPELVERVVEEIRRFTEYGKRVYFVPLGLGEPLLYKDLFGLFGRIKKISGNIGIVLVTNGLLLTEESVKRLIGLGIDEVSVSLNAGNKDDYKEYMGLDAYKKICANIEAAIKLRNESGRTRPGIFVQYIDYGGGPAALKDGIRKWNSIMKFNDKCYVHPIVNQAGLFRDGYGYRALARKYPCNEPLWRVAIKVNGDMYPCDSSLYSGSEKLESLYLGNIGTDSPFEMYLDPKSRQRRIVELMRKDDYSTLAQCRNCNTYKLGCNAYFGLPGNLRIKGYRWI